jgi:hypothetical protein
VDTPILILPWELYDLDRLKAEARARLLAQGDDPRDSLKVYHMVTKLRGEELRRKLPVVDAQVLVPEERRLPAVPEARSAKE